MPESAVEFEMQLASRLHVAVKPVDLRSGGVAMRLRCSMLTKCSLLKCVEKVRVVAIRLFTQMTSSLDRSPPSRSDILRIVIICKDLR